MAPNPTATSDTAQTDLQKKLAEVLVRIGVKDEVEEILVTEPAELKGEHMATETVYAQVRFKDPALKPKNLFVKKFSGNELHTKMVKGMMVMEKEASFFNHFLPQAREFCVKNTGRDDLLDFFPKCLYGDDETIVLENCVLDDTFIMLPKEDMQDLYTAKFVLNNMATFHGVTYAIIQATGAEEFKAKWAVNVTESFDPSKNPLLGQMYDNGIGTCVTILTGHATEGTEYGVEKLGSFVGKITPEIFQLFEDGLQSKFAVLNHGDAWNNNMLFKRDSETGRVNDHIFVDFQITRFGSPCLDLGYFLYTSVKHEVRRTKLHELLKHYYQKFNETIALFDLKCPLSYEEFFEDYKKNCKLGFCTSLSMMSAIGAFKEMDMDSMGTDPEEIMNCFNKIILEWIAKNPETVSKTAVDIIGTLREFDQLQSA